MHNPRLAHILVYSFDAKGKVRPGPVQIPSYENLLTLRSIPFLAASVLAIGLAKILASPATGATGATVATGTGAENGVRLVKIIIYV